MSEPVHITAPIEASDVVWSVFDRAVHGREGLLTVFFSLIFVAPLLFGVITTLFRPDLATRAPLFFAAFQLTVVGVILGRAVHRHTTQGAPPVRLTASDAGIAVESPKQKHLTWEAVRSWHETGRHIVLMTADPRHLIVIPLRHVQDERRWLLRAHLKRHKVRSTQFKNRSTGSRAFTVIACGLTLALVVWWAWALLTLNPAQPPTATPPASHQKAQP